MTGFLTWLQQALNAWKLWVVVPPWEIGVRVRLGRNAVALPPGLHLQVPLVDAITLVNTRTRIISTPPVTLTEGRFSRTRTAVVDYRIADPLRAMMAFSQPGTAVQARAQGMVSDLLTGPEVQQKLASELAGAGIVVERVKLVEDLLARPFRILQHSTWCVETGEHHDSAPGRY